METMPDQETCDLETTTDSEPTEDLSEEWFDAPEVRARRRWSSTPPPMGDALVDRWLK